MREGGNPRVCSDALRLCSLVPFSFFFLLISIKYGCFGVTPWLSGKESTCNVGDTGDSASITGSGRFPWRRAWQPTPVFLPGEAHGQRSLVGYRLWCRKESDMTEATELTHVVALLCC